MLKKSWKDSFFVTSYEVQSCWQLKNDQSSLGVDSCLTAVTANFSKNGKCLKTEGRARFSYLTMKYKVVGN